MSANGRPRTNSPNVATSVADLTHDVIELSELQAKLVMLDLKASSERARMCLVLVVVALAVLLGTIPVGLIALGYGFSQWFEWSLAGGMALAAVVGLAITAGILAAAYSTFQKGLLSLDRSRDEFNRNITWLKSTLRNRGAAAPPPVETPLPY